MREITHIVLHHTAGSDHADRLEKPSIRNYHIHTRGWSDIGYHFIVEKYDKEYEVIVGRPLDIPGAHVRGHNQNSIGIALVGNYEQDTPTQEAYDTIADRIVKPLKRIFPDAEIVGHFDLAATKCPGSNFSVCEIKERVKSD
jgi:hypothetical protein